jgi:hypothetical protein
MTSGTLIGYALVSTDAQDLTAQRDALSALGVPLERIYSDRGMTGSNRAAGAQGGAGSLPAGRHPGGDEARSPRAVAARRNRHR